MNPYQQHRWRRSEAALLDEFPDCLGVGQGPTSVKAGNPEGPGAEDVVEYPGSILTYLLQSPFQTLDSNRSLAGSSVYETSESYGKASRLGFQRSAV